MEFIFKRHFWVVHLLFIGCAAFLVARSINAFAESCFMPVRPEQTHLVRRTRLAQPAQGLDGERLSKSMGIQLVRDNPVIERIPEESGPVRSSLKVRLLGTLIAALPEWSFASIKDDSSLKPQTYMIGDIIQHATIVEIGRSRVLIENQGRREYIDASSSDRSALENTKNSATATSGTLVASIKSVSENEFDVSRSEFLGALNNLPEVAMHARIVPAFKQGKAMGFKLFSIRPDSLYTRIGLHNGDLLKRINGYDLSTPETVLGMYTALQNASRIEIEIERDGSSLRKTFHIN